MLKALCIAIFFALTASSNATAQPFVYSYDQPFLSSWGLAHVAPAPVPFGNSSVGYIGSRSFNMGAELIWWGPTGTVLRHAQYSAQSQPEGTCTQSSQLVGFNIVEQLDDGTFIASFDQQTGPPDHYAGLLRLNSDFSINWANLYIGTNESMESECGKCPREPVVRSYYDASIAEHAMLLVSSIRDGSSVLGSIAFIEESGALTYSEIVEDPDAPDRHLVFVDACRVSNGWVVAGNVLSTGPNGPICPGESGACQPVQCFYGDNGSFVAVEFDTEYPVTECRGITAVSNDRVAHSWTSINPSTGLPHTQVVLLNATGTSVDFAYIYATPEPHGMHAIHAQSLTGEGEVISFGGPCPEKENAFVMSINTSGSALYYQLLTPEFAMVDSVNSRCMTATLTTEGWCIGGDVAEPPAAYRTLFGVLDSDLDDGCEPDEPPSRTGFSFNILEYEPTRTEQGDVYEACLDAVTDNSSPDDTCVE